MVAKDLEVRNVLQVDSIVKDAIMQSLALQFRGRVIPFLFAQRARVIGHRLPPTLIILLLQDAANATAHPAGIHLQSKLLGVVHLHQHRTAR